MSRDAIAAVLARDDLACGDRLAAFSLASFAGREHRALPGAAAAAQRAGLSRSRYLQARDRLVRRGLVSSRPRRPGGDGRAPSRWRLRRTGRGGRARSTSSLFEAVLGHSSATGAARLLLAAMAALADADGAVRDFTTEQICAAAGIAAKSYQRAKTELLTFGALVLVNGVGGRGNMNSWTVPDPRVPGAGGVAQRAPRRVVPPAGLRGPFVGVRQARRRRPGAMEAGGAADGVKGGQHQTVSAQNRLTLTGLSAAKGGHDSDTFRPGAAGKPGANPGRKGGRKGGQKRGAQRARGIRTLNPRTGRPPQPPWRGEPA